MKKAVGIIMVVGLSACGGAAPVGPDVSRIGSQSEVERSDSSGIGQSTQDFPFRRILCFGDSLTYGTTSRTLGGLPTLTAVEGYVPKLARLLSAEYGEGFDLINQGIGGETSTEGLDRLGGQVRLFHPDLVLLLHGIVDVNNELPRFPVVRANLSDMMRICIRHDVPVIIGTYPPLNPEGFRIRGIDNVPRLNDVIRQEAKKQDVPVADHEKSWSGDLTMQGPDGLHPNDSGYERMAETWFQAIQDLVAQMST
jgi:lysophospholipase L1-like esterase